MNQSDKARKVFAYYWKHAKNYPRYLSRDSIAIAFDSTY
jgi:hypothetical protein